MKALFQLGLEPLALNSLYKFGLWTGHYKRVGESELKNSPPVHTFQPLFSLPSREQLLQTLGADGKTALIGEADEIAGDGRFRMFGGEPVPIQLTFNGPLHHWSDYETGRTPIPYSQLPIQDVKFLWEPARFGWAFTLGRAYHITRDEKYAEAFWKYFETFTDDNPPYLGPHWMNGQEVAIRRMFLAGHKTQTGTGSCLIPSCITPSGFPRPSFTLVRKIIIISSLKQLLCIPRALPWIDRLGANWVGPGLIVRFKPRSVHTANIFSTARIITA